MRNVIEENWKPEYNTDLVLSCMYNKMKEAFLSYEKDGSCAEKIKDLQKRFKVYVHHKYGVHIDLS